VGIFMTAALAGGCSSTYQARRVSPSGFLGDYSQLKPGEGEEALMVYVKPQVDFSRYDRVMIDPVIILADEGGILSRVSREDLQRLANYLDATLRTQMRADYAIVDKAGPGVLRLRVAITEAKGSKVIMDVASSLMPIGLALSELKNIATGSHSAVGSVGIECEGLDSESGTRLFAAADARVGRKFTGQFDKFDKWRTSKDAFDFWAQRLQLRLREERGKGGK
jgi:hypothetical protein